MNLLSNTLQGAYNSNNEIDTLFYNTDRIQASMIWVVKAVKIAFSIEISAV